MGEGQLSHTVDGPALIYQHVAAAVLSLSIITNNDFDDFLSMQPFLFHVKYYCDVTIGVTTHQR